MSVITNSQKSWKSLGFVISFPFGVLLVISFVLFNFLAIFSVKHSIFLLVDQLTQKTSEQIKNNLQNYFEKPLLLNKLNTDAFAYGSISRDELFKKPEAFFFRQHFQFTTVGDIFFGDKNGAICGVDRTDNKYLVKFTTDFPKREFYELDEKGNRTKLVKKNTYSALERDWFKNAKEKKKPSWTGIYVFKNKNKLGITASAPAYNPNGEFEGAMAVHLTLDRISEFLQKSKISQNTTVFMIEKTGHLVASSEKEQLFKMVKDKPTRILATESVNNIIKSTMFAINDKAINLSKITQNQILKIEIDEADYLLQISNFKDDFGLDFLIVTVVNELDFMSDIYRTLKISSAIALIIIIILIIIGYMLSKIITKPIKLLSSETHNLALGEGLGKNILVNSDTYEIKLLIDAFNSMSQHSLKSVTIDTNESNVIMNKA